MKRIINIFRLKPDYDSRVFGLDLMRSLAIIFVVMGHGLMLNTIDTGFPWIKTINGVELFFVLSGFLIGGILLKIFFSNEPYKFTAIKNFWIRRWFRTLPNYYLILILNVLFIYFGIIKEDLTQFNWKFFFFLQNLYDGFVGFFWVSWSLTIEEWFYLTFPIILGLLFFLLKPMYRKKKIFFLAILVFLITPFFLRYLKASKLDVDNFWREIKIFKVVIYRLDGIAFGLLGAFIKHFYSKYWYKSRNILFVAGLIVNYFVLYSHWGYNTFNSKVYWMFLTSLGCFLLLPKFDSLKINSPIIVRIVTHISLISYSMYLINLSLVAEVIVCNIEIKGAASAWGLYAAFWIITILLSTLLYKYFEKPMMDLRERWKS